MPDNIPLSLFASAIGYTIDSVLIADTESVIQYVNPAFTEITGYTPEEALGQKPSILKSRHTTQDIYEDMWSVILSGGWWRGEIINQRKNGEEWFSYLSISQIKDQQGQVQGYVGIARDITPMKQLQNQLREASLEAIFMLSVACEAKDEVTGGHVLRVQQYSCAIARELGLARSQAEEIGYSSMMHDVGKIHIPDRILKKQGPLEDAEWQEMLQHPEHGMAILRDKPFYETARQIASCHHEKWDGSGYPNQLQGPQIPLPARIVAVADVFDALTTRRPYKEPWTEEQAMEEIRRLSGQSFDPRVVNAFEVLYERGEISRIRREFP